VTARGSFPCRNHARVYLSPARSEPGGPSAYDPMRTLPSLIHGIGSGSPARVPEGTGSAVERRG